MAINFCNFDNAFADLKPKILIFIFLDVAQEGLLKTTQNHILRCLGSRENVKTKRNITLVETSILTITNMVSSKKIRHTFSNSYCRI